MINLKTINYMNLTRYIFYTLVSVPILIMFSYLLGIVAIILVYSFPIDYDVSSEPKYGQIMKHTFYLNEDIFLYSYADEENTTYVSGPKHDMLPSSIEDYLKEPTRWQFTDEWAKKGYGILDNRPKADVEGVLYKGTHITVTRAISSRKLGENDSGSYIIYGNAQGVVDKFGQPRSLRITDLFDGKYDKDRIVSINDKLLRSSK